MNTNFIWAKTSREIELKWFSVYNYISSRELLLTVRKDFLDILSAINIPFWIICIVLWVISYYSGAFFLALGFIWVSYLIIFTIILAKLIKKTYYFFLISNVVYTHSWIIFWKDFYEYEDSEKLNKSISHYESFFLEYLWKDSKLEWYISEKRSELIGLKWWIYTFNKLTKGFDIFKWRKDFDSDIWKIAIPAFISFVLYVIFMNIFYALGYFFGIVFMNIYLFFIRILLSFKKSKELHLKEKTENLDSRLKHMNEVQLLLSQKIESFRWGKIEEISKQIKKSFDLFYSDILRVFNEKKDLEKFIMKSKYQDFIDFWLFETYLKDEFNKPVYDMLGLMSDYRKKLITAQTNLKNNTSEIDEYQAQLDTKYILLENNLNLVSQQISKLTSSLL